MSLLEFLILSLGLWFGLACLGLAAWALIASRLSPTPDSDDPDATVDDPDEDVVRIDRLPEVPPPARWTDADDAMVAWFVAGRAER